MRFKQIMMLKDMASAFPGVIIQSYLVLDDVTEERRERAKELFEYWSSLYQRVANDESRETIDELKFFLYKLNDHCNGIIILSPDNLAKLRKMIDLVAVFADISEGKEVTEETRSSAADIIHDIKEMMWL